jgi:hypothetical protein
LVSSNFWPLYRLSFYLLLLISSLWYLQTFGHCIVCPSIYYFWLSPFDIFKLLTIVLSVLLFTTSDYLPLISSNFWPLYHLSFYLLLLITSLWYLQTFDHCIVCPSIYYFWLPPFGIFKPLTIVSCVLLFTTSDYLLWYLQTFGHCIVCPSIYYFWLPLWYLQTFDHCIVCPSIYYFWLPPLISSNFWPLYRVSFYFLLLITSLWYLQTFDHCIVCPSIYYFWLPPFDIFKLLAIVSSVLLFTTSDYLL